MEGGGGILIGSGGAVGLGLALGFVAGAGAGVGGSGLERWRSFCVSMARRLATGMYSS